MKQRISWQKTIALFMAVIIMVGMMPITAMAAPPANLTWDGEAATLADIAKNTGYDMVGTNGNYKPLYYYYASELWNNGLFLGSNGSFDLDNPLTRAEGVVMTIRLLGKETEAKAATGPITFTDVPDWAKPYITYAAQNGIANGYNTTTFGSNDPMTAAQFITLVLRAMGYKDNEDFTWDKSYDKAVEVGLIGQPCHTQYSRSNLFLRDNAAVIAYNAVFKAQTKSGSLLKDTIKMPGKPTSSVPTATRAEISLGDEQNDGFIIEITNVIVSKPYVTDKGATETGEILVDFTVISGSGLMTYYITGHSGSTTKFAVDVGEGENYRVSRKYKLSQPFTGTSEPFILTWSGGGETRTISVANTNMHSKIEVGY